MQNRRARSERREKDLKTIGMQLALQLPHDRVKALEILDHARWLIENYMHTADHGAGGTIRPPALKVVR
ncbi:hypothetical protein [Methylobacterium sp. D54C]